MTPPTSLPADQPPDPAGSGVVARDHALWFKDNIHAHDRVLKAYLRGKFPQIKDVEDVVHDSYIRVWRRHAARPVQYAKAFLFTVARNLALTRLRDLHAAPLATDVDAAGLEVTSEENLPEAACQEEEARLVRDAIRSLPARGREVYMLRKLEGLSQKEIAERLKISARTVEAHLAAAHKRCEHYLRGHGVIRGSER